MRIHRDSSGTFPAHVLALALLLACVAACAMPPSTRRASVLEYLYPTGTGGSAPQDVELRLPLRVGVAFAPTKQSNWDRGIFDEQSRRDLAERIAAAFRGRPEIQSVEVLPTTQLVEGGGFENLDRLAALYGLDVVALLSYEQVQFTDETLASITYWTIVGAYVVEGNRNETRTMLDATVLDVRSRALLFNASGSSKVEKSSTAIDLARAERDASLEGFGSATDQLIANLELALERFREQAKSGTVRGQGTPALKVTAADGSPAGAGVGAFGGWQLCAVLLLACAAAARPTLGGRRES